eukprot:scaffold5606_cov30-Prasinocladus_malaysianus.AAC.1
MNPSASCQHSLLLGQAKTVCIQAFLGTSSASLAWFRLPRLASRSSPAFMAAEFCSFFCKPEYKQRVLSTAPCMTGVDQPTRCKQVEAPLSPPLLPNLADDLHGETSRTHNQKRQPRLNFRRR